MKKIILTIVFFLVSASPALARSGCCSHHSGVCGCGCCDGTRLSATCRPYYGDVCGTPRVVTTPTPTIIATSTPTKAPVVVTVAPKKVVSPTPTKVPTTTPIRKISPTPTIKNTPTPTEEISATPATTEVLVTPKESVSPTIQAVKTTQGRGFWGWLSKLFGGK